MKLNKAYLISVVLFSLLFFAGCEALPQALSGQAQDNIEASGIVQAVEISVAPELNGRVSAVHVQESDHVQEDEVLFKLDDALLSSRRKQAQAQHEAALANLESVQTSLEVAEAAVKAAQAGLEQAEVQYEQTMHQARAEEAENRVDDWQASQPSEVELPAWYFQKEEQIQAAKAEVEAAQAAYQAERENLTSVLEELGNSDLLDAEKRLSEAKAAFWIAEELLDREVSGEGRDEIEDYAQTVYDAAETELKAAQEAYDQLLSTAQGDDLTEARARVSVSEERYELALDYLQSLFVGRHAYAVQAAEARVNQAKAALDQAQAQTRQIRTNVKSARKAVEQAQAALELVELQMEKLSVAAPRPGVILSSNIEKGEILQAGSTAMIIGDLAELTVTVYIPEDRYGQISLGDTAQLQSDSFPEETFQGTVIRIADEAEYTPRNVQTKEERQTTVYAIELSVENPDGKLKPGMPVDVTFES
jgi:multidrug resistance efflux pump